MRWHGRRVQVYAYTRPTDMRSTLVGRVALAPPVITQFSLAADHES